MMSDMILRALSAFVAICGLIIVVQGVRAGLSTPEGRDKFQGGLVLILMVGSNMLPASLAWLRDGLVVAGCLLLLGSIVWRSRRQPDDGGVP